MENREGGDSMNKDLDKVGWGGGLGSGREGHHSYMRGPSIKSELPWKRSGGHAPSFQ